MCADQSARKPARVAIYVKGGVVQDVMTDSANVEAMVVDYDNERSGDDPEDRSFQPVPVNRAYIEKTIRGIED